MISSDLKRPCSANGEANLEKQAENYGMKDGERADLSIVNQSLGDNLSFIHVSEDLLLGDTRTRSLETQKWRLISIVILNFSFVQLHTPYFIGLHHVMSCLNLYLSSYTTSNKGINSPPRDIPRFENLTECAFYFLLRWTRYFFLTIF